MARTFNLFRERRVAFLSLKNIEQTPTHRQETEAAAGKKNSANKRLLSQRGKRGILKVADFGDELLERLLFRTNFVARLGAKPS